MRSTHGQRPRQTVEDMKKQRAARNRRDAARLEQADRERLQKLHARAQRLRAEGMATRPTTREGMIAAGLIKVS